MCICDIKELRPKTTEFSVHWNCLIIQNITFHDVNIFFFLSFQNQRIYYLKLYTSTLLKLKFSNAAQWDAKPKILIVQLFETPMLISMGVKTASKYSSWTGSQSWQGASVYCLWISVVICLWKLCGYLHHIYTADSLQRMKSNNHLKLHSLFALSRKYAFLAYFSSCLAFRFCSYIFSEHS